MAYCFVSVHPERFQHSAHEDQTPFASLLRIAETAAGSKLAEDIDGMRKDVKYGSDFHPELQQAGFQLELAKVLETGHALFLELPTWLDTLPVPDVLQGMYKAFTVLYLVSAGAPDKPNVGNFLLLHLLTSLWGADHVVQALADDAQQRSACKCFWAAAIATLATGAAMSPQGMPTRSAVEQTWQQYDVCDGSADAAEHVGSCWQEIVRSAHYETEEHNIKLAYIMRELWRRHDGWRGFQAAAAAFTETPNIGPGRAKFYD